MKDFRITSEWLEMLAVISSSAANVTLPGDEMLALLIAARRGMRHPPPPTTEIFDYVSADNPNWRRFHKEQKDDNERKSRAPANLKLVDK